MTIEDELRTVARETPQSEWDALDGIEILFDPAQLYKKAIFLWGMDSQIDMMIEECAEAIHALQKLKRDRISVDDVAFELADVEIMCGQMRVVFGDRIIDKCKKIKLKRLSCRLCRQ